MQKVKLGDICKLVNGFAFQSENYVSNGLRIIRIANVQKGYIEDNTPCYYPLSMENQLSKYKLYENDLLISLTGNVGRVALVNKKLLPAVLNQRVACLRVNNDKLIDKQYLFALLNSDFFETKCIRAANGVAQKNLSTEWLKNFEIPLPSIEEQKVIAERLDKVSELIDKRKEQIKKLDLLIKSRFIEMFGDPETNPHLWVVENLSMHLNIIGGYAFKSENFIESGIPVLRIGNINTGKFTANNLVFWHNDKNLDDYKILPGDLVMSFTGTVGKEDYGNVCILGNDYPEYYLNQRNAKLHLNSTLHKIYLAELFRFSSIKKRLTNINRGVRQANISNKDILGLRVPIPPIYLQNEFAEFVEKTDKLKQTIKNNLEKLETLKKSLMQQYFG